MTNVTAPVRKGWLIFGLTLGLLCASLPDAFAQNISITDSVTGDVSGNGTSPNGTGYAGVPNDNTVEVGSNGSVSGGSVFGGQADASSAVSVERNQVTIYGHTADTYHVYGGYAGTSSGTAVAKGNKVFVKNGGWVGSKVLGGDAYRSGSGSDSATAEGNTVTVENGGRVGWEVLGGYAESRGSATATGNIVTISGGTVNSNVFGGWADSYSATATAEGNIVTISGGTVAGNVYGGFADSDGSGMYSIARGNTVTLSGGAVHGNIFGGFSKVDGLGEIGSATGNTVTISGSINLGANTLYGGFVGKDLVATSGDAFTNNTLNMNAAPTQIGAVRNFNTINFTYAGNANINTLDTTPTGSSQTTVTLNTNANAINFAGSISGAGSIAKTGTGTLTLGGNVNQINVSANAGKLVVSNGVSLTASGAFTLGNSTALGLSVGATPVVSAGSVSIGSGVTFDITGYTPDESVPYNASRNIQTLITSSGITGSNPAGTVAGQANADFLSASVFKDGNDIKVETRLTWDSTDPTRKAHGDFTIADGQSFSMGAVLGDNSASTNKQAGWDGNSLTKKGEGTLILTGNNTYTGNTTISAGTLQIGAGGTTGGITGDILNNATLVFNRSDTVTYGDVISGSGTLTKTGAGTLILSGANSYGGMTRVETGTLALSGSGAISDLLTIHGGATFDDGSNTVNLSQLEVRGLNANYTGNLNVAGGTMNFYLPASAVNNDTMLNVTGTADIFGSRVNLGIDGQSSPLQKGDQITLIDASAGMLGGAPVNSTTNGQGMLGVTLKYEFELLVNGNKLLANVTKTGLNEQTKALSEGYLAGMILVNQGADLLAGQGIDSAVRAARTARAGLTTNYGLATFGTISGGSVRYHTGSHVDMSSISLLTGLSWGADLRSGGLTLGAFFDYGNGSYDTHNSFAPSASVQGGGDIYYLGGGILGRMDFVNTGSGHFYAEASGRAGNVHNKYGSSDLSDFTGRQAEYASSSPYYGLHFGTGYVWNINDAASLDLHGKYFWTRQERNSVTLSTGDPVSFADANSTRLRLGSRFAYRVNQYVSPYVGAAWEHEFDGKVRATTNGYAIDSPKLRGDSGIGELGLTFTPSSSLPLSFDLGVQGYVGKREGVTGSLQATLKF
ncbi:MAG: autotransporter-associated beta strand repeat-containing protein [Planctomycetota bacterium]|jgi:autotransporter-associated beta strand protein|nr:autotransporter-associated beta strand repeat-containing protein [Planctomycetota bacterium]